MYRKPKSFIEAMRLPALGKGDYFHKFRSSMMLEGNLILLKSDEHKHKLNYPGFFWANSDKEESVIASIPEGKDIGSKENIHVSFNLASSHDNSGKIKSTGFFDFGLRQDIVKTMLNSWRIKFLGQSKTNRLYHYYGESAFEMIEHCPDEVMKKIFIDNKQMERLISEVIYIKENIFGIQLLIEHKMQTPEIDLIVDMFAGSKEQGVTFNPFMILKRRRGTKEFESRFFSAMGIPSLLEKEPHKVIGMYIDMLLSSTGDTAIEYDKAVESCSTGLHLSKAKTEKIIRKMVEDGEALHRKMWGLNLLTTGKMLVTEKEISKGIGKRSENPHDNAWVEEFKPQTNTQGKVIELSEKQKMAIQVAITSKTSVITGGPGTGKTTIIQTLIKEIRRLNPEGKILLACPTGKAARRMTETTGESATTLHKMMGMTPDSSSMMGQFEEFDTLILDEASMMDIHLLSAAIRHTHSRGRVVFVGDPNQIPSIENGSILTDIILSRQVAISMLTKPERYAGDSDIENAAYSVINGVVPEITNEKDFHFIEIDEDKEDMNEIIKDLVVNKLPIEKGIEPEGIQLLASMRKGNSGVNRLNVALKSSFNPACLDRDTEYRALGNQVYHVGDRVMQLKNRYDLDIQNGEIGIISGFDDKNRKVLMQMDDNRVIHLPYENYPFMTHAWSSTIHKSQGSEYDCVIVALSREHEYMLNRKLLYTAITRGKKHVVVIGSRDVFENTIKKKMRTIPSSSPLAKNIERLTLLPYLIADELCLNTPNDIFRKMSINSNKYHNLPEKKHAIDLDNIVLPF